MRNIQFWNWACLILEVLWYSQKTLNCLHVRDREGYIVGVPELFRYFIEGYSPSSCELGPQVTFVNIKAMVVVAVAEMAYKPVQKHSHPRYTGVIYIYIYIHIYMCVCVCMCACVWHSTIFIGYYLASKYTISPWTPSSIVNCFFPSRQSISSLSDQWFRSPHSLHIHPVGTQLSALSVLAGMFFSIINGPILQRCQLPMTPQGADSAAYRGPGQFTD